MGIFENKYPYTDFHELNLDWVLSNLQTVIKEIDTLDEWKTTHEAEYEELKAFYDKVIAGDFPDSVKEAFAKWMNENAVSIVGSMVKNVYFGLTDAGYFCAYIPSSWADITFNTTGLDITEALMPEYGHLVLSY